MREFETVLNAFSKVKSNQWQLLISTRDTSYAEEMREAYPDIKNHIKIYNAKTKDDLLALIAKADIGVALLPDIPIYNSSTPVKIFNYYSSAVPCLMTNSSHTNTIFTDCTDAWFIGFSPSITVGVWVGNDQKTSLGPDETGGKTALPIFIDFMFHPDFFFTSSIQAVNSQE